jgi:hypothetical protein
VVRDADTREFTMKAAKLVIGSISLLVFGIGIALAVVNGISSNDVDVHAATTGTSVMVFAFSAAFAVGGIVVIARRNREGRDVTAGIPYWLAALIGLAGLNADGDVVIWAVPLIVWAAVAGTLGFVLMVPAGPSRAQ